MSSKSSLTSVKLNKFDPRTMEKRRTDGNPPTCIFIGKRGTGKSTLISDIMYYMRTIPYGLIISGTEEGNGFYKNYFPDLFIHSEYRSEIVESLVKRQKKILKEKDKNPKTNPHAFLLLDDLMFDKSITNEKIIRMIFMNGRHWKLLFILSLQYCMSIRPELRSNVDYLFILRENNIDNQKKLWRSYFGMFEKFQDFQQTFMACTENYECIVLDNTSKSNKIEDCVYWYKAVPDRKYKIGCLALWKYAANHYNKKYEMEDEDEKEDRKKKVRRGLVVKKNGVKITKSKK